MGDDYIRRLAKIIGMNPEELLAVKYALKMQRQGTDITELIKALRPLDPDEEKVLALARSQDYVGLRDWATRKLKSQDAKPAMDSAPALPQSRSRRRSSAALAPGPAQGTE